MDGLSVKMHRPNTTTNERPRFDRAPQTNDRNVIAIVDLKFARKLGRHFREQFRLQLCEMTEEARHAASGMMLGQSIGC